MNQQSSQDSLFSLIRDVPDFPKPGILFKDITPVLECPESFSQLIEQMCEDLPPEANKLVGIESRGFLLASAMAKHSHKGLVIARKPGKLPGPVLRQTYALEYGQDEIQIHQGSLSSSDRIVIVDDVLATGGTAQACEKLCLSAETEVLGFSFMMEIAALQGRNLLKAPVHCLYSVK